ncbi:MAG: hypothetical protein LUD72_08610, partial [Bacteroidales bacterium]|nr:hypothetical protein [Bacteroidales bacterium]
MDEAVSAWMIREDGVAIPCVQHIYGSLDCIEETLYAAEWLYKNTQHEETRKLVLRFISAYASSLNPDGDPIRNLLDQIADQPYVTLPGGFIQEVGSALIRTKEDLRELNRQVCETLNEEFLRARLGGMYNTIEGNRDIYFRVSSEKQNWEEMVR